jgi:hypothetical protein
LRRWRRAHLLSEIACPALPSDWRWLGFNAYLANFGSHNTTDGVLGVLVVFSSSSICWRMFSASGPQSNVELEKQTAVGTPVGRDRSAGKHGARVADLVAVE